MKKIILLASIVFFLFAPITYHPDTKLTLRYPAFENNKVWDIYKYLNEHNTDVPDFHYPPIHYFWLKIHYPISKFIGGSGFDSWLSSGSAQAGDNLNVFRYSLAAKFPLLVLGLLSGYLIYLIVSKWSKDKNKGKLAAIFWYFNPITIYSLVLMGQNDIVAIFMFLLGLYFLEKSWFCILFWGLAAGVKSYPLIWSIIFLLSWEKNIWRLIFKSAGVVLIYALSLLPWLGKSYFSEAVLNSGLSQRMFIANIPIGFDKVILIVPLLLSFIAIKCFNKRIKHNIALASLSVSQASLVILAFSHFNPQWMLWLVPFWAIYTSIKGVSKSDSLIYIIIFLSWIILTFGFDDKFLTWGLINPLIPSLINYPSPIEFLSRKGVNTLQVVNLSQSLLASATLYFIFYKRKKGIKITFQKINKFWVLVPWLVILFLITFSVTIKTDNKTSHNLKEKVLISDISNKEYTYKSIGNLKYIEIFFDNPELNSFDKAEIEVSDNNGNKMTKGFSGVNTEINSWLRVDIPNNISNSEELKIMITKTDITDGKLMTAIDDENKLLANFYYHDSQSFSILLNKIKAFWWWWLLLLLATVFYLRNFEKEA